MQYLSQSNVFTKALVLCTAFSKLDVVSFSVADRLEGR